MRRATPIIAAIGLGTLLLISGPADAEPLSQQQRSEDTRLERHVTIEEHQLYVGELLKQLSRQTGVSLEAGGQSDGAGDEEVMVSLRNVKLGDALNAVWSLFSYRGAGWHWTRAGAQGDYRYRLIRPRRAQLLAAELRQQAQHAYDAHTERALELAQLPNSQFARVAKSDRAMAKVFDMPRVRLALALFGKALSPAQRTSVLSGGSAVTQPVAELGEAGQAFVGHIYDEMVPLANRRPTTLPPDQVTFHAKRSPGNMFPTVFVQAGWLGGYGYLGGRTLQSEFQPGLEALWLCPGDLRTSGAEERVAAQSVPGGAETKSSDIPVFQERLRQMAVATPVSFLARLPEDASQRFDPGSPVGSSLGKFLLALRSKAPYLMHKWRSGVLLLSDPAWWVKNTKKPPYQVVQKLESARAKNQGVLHSTDIGFAASQLDEDQLFTLASRFPVMRNVAYWRPLFAVMGGNAPVAEDLVAPEGALVGDLMRLSALPVDTSLTRAALSSRASRVRIAEKLAVESERRVLRIRIELLSSTGKSLHAVDIRQEPGKQ